MSYDIELYIGMSMFKKGSVLISIIGASNSDLIMTFWRKAVLIGRCVAVVVSSKILKNLTLA